MTPRLGDRALAILRYLRQRREPYPASYREIQAACGLSSTSVVSYNLGKLERAGLVTRNGQRDQNRAVTLVRPPCSCDCDGCRSRCV